MDLEFYSTPGWVVALLQAHVQGFEKSLGVFDPCAGDGAILSCYDGARQGIEIDPGRAWEAGVECYDALTSTWDVPDSSVVVFNPPYSFAFDFARKAIEEGVESFAMLSPLYYLVPKKNRMLAGAPEYRPLEAWVIPDRIKFSGKPTAHIYDHAWFIWRANLNGPTSIRYFPRTPSSER